MDTLSLQDETTFRGVMILFLEFFVKARLLCLDVEEDIFTPADRWENRWLFLTGDGLTLEKFFQFGDNVVSVIEVGKSNFIKAYEQAVACYKRCLKTSCTGQRRSPCPFSFPGHNLPPVLERIFTSGQGSIEVEEGGR
jgi:hypothetical protein